MEWILIYLFVQIEKIAVLLAVGSSVFWWSSISAVLTYAVSFVLSKDKESLEEWIGKTKKFRRWSSFIAFIGVLMFVTSALLPSKKDLAIIVAAGTAYNVITSPQAKEIGGKALDLLKKQMDDALKDSDVKEILKEKAKQEIKDAVSS